MCQRYCALCDVCSSRPTSGRHGRGSLQLLTPHHSSAMPAPWYLPQTARHYGGRTTCINVRHTCTCLPALVSSCKLPASTYCSCCKGLLTETAACGLLLLPCCALRCLLLLQTRWYSFQFLMMELVDEMDRLYCCIQKVLSALPHGL